MVAATVACQAPYSPSSAATASSSSAPTRGRAAGDLGAPAERPGRAPLERTDGTGLADGAVPDGTTVFDDWVPAVSRLDVNLLHALRRAARSAADEGVRFVVNGGWRSPSYEEHLRREAVAKYGSEKEAARWVATATTSAHVTGDAVDLGPARADAWLSRHGAAYGLCQIYRNEPWHYELRPKAVSRGCPPMYADPTQDPRMQR